MADDRSPLEKLSDGKAEPLPDPPRLKWLHWTPTWVIAGLGAFGAMVLRGMVPSRPWAGLSGPEKTRDLALVVGGALVLWLFRWLAAPAPPKPSKDD